MGMDAVQQQMAAAVAGAMRTPGVEVTEYSDTDRRVLAGDADRLRARADRLVAMGKETGGADANRE
jgi:hypothetical protein